MSAQEFFNACLLVALALLIASFVLVVVRILKGPTVPDRVLALDMLVSVGVGFIAVIGAKTQHYLYIDIAIALGLVGFLATVAFARFVLHRGIQGERPDNANSKNTRTPSDVS